MVFFQRGDKRSFREAILAVNNLCGATSTTHRQSDGNDGKGTKINGALVCVDYKHHASRSPRSNEEEDEDEEQISPAEPVSRVGLVDVAWLGAHLEIFERGKARGYLY